MAYIIVIIFAVHFGTLHRKRLEKVYIQRKIEEKDWMLGLKEQAAEAEMQALRGRGRMAPVDSEADEFMTG